MEGPEKLGNLGNDASEDTAEMSIARNNSIETIHRLHRSWSSAGLWICQM